MHRCAVATFVAFILAVPSASASPRILHARLLEPAVAGAPSTLMIRVRDPLASVNGIQVAYGDGSSTRLSACRPANGRPFLPFGVFAPGHADEFTVGHVFARAGKVDVAVTAMSGDCVSGVATDAVVLHLTVHDATGPLRSTAKTSAAFCDDALALPSAATRGAMRDALDCLVDAIRTSKGLGTLRAKKALRVAASRHAADMVRRGYFSHVSPDGHDLAYRLRRAKFRLNGAAGENIASGTEDLASAAGTLVAWMNSPPHRANLLEPAFTMVGIGVARGGPGFADDSSAATWVMDLAG